MDFCSLTGAATCLQFDAFHFQGVVIERIHFSRGNSFILCLFRDSLDQQHLSTTSSSNLLFAAQEVISMIRVVCKVDIPLWNLANLPGLEVASLLKSVKSTAWGTNWNEQVANSPIHGWLSRVGCLLCNYVCWHVGNVPRCSMLRE